MTMNQIREHFEAEAEEFDEIIKKLIPYYDQMIRALIDSLNFDNNSVIRIIDLGCGTGTVAKRISEKFPNSKIVCLDIASKLFCHRQIIIKI
jgi:tRNA (cmo5U34)-methyltransferase